MNIAEWLKYGIDNGYCTEQQCLTHTLELTEQEQQQYENDEDSCIFIIRLKDTEQ
jgi:hypothetical protein